jgi:hypothetical protein
MCNRPSENSWDKKPLQELTDIMPKVAFNDDNDRQEKQEASASHPPPRKLYSVVDAISSSSNTMHRDECYGQVNSDSEWPEPLDGGYGWLVVVASFFAHLIADGCGFSFGVFFVELVEVFQETRSTTAWVGSLFVAMPSVCGPLASAITSSYGCRCTMMFGGLIAAIGCMASAFVTSIGLLCFTFGFVAGFGLSLVFVPAIVIVAFYFKKRRALATGQYQLNCDFYTRCCMANYVIDIVLVIRSLSFRRCRFLKRIQREIIRVHWYIAAAVESSHVA